MLMTVSKSSPRSKLWCDQLWTIIQSLVHKSNQIDNEWIFVKTSWFRDYSKCLKWKHPKVKVFMCMESISHIFTIQKILCCAIAKCCGIHVHVRHIIYINLLCKNTLAFWYLANKAIYRGSKCQDENGLNKKTYFFYTGTFFSQQ